MSDSETDSPLKQPPQTIRPQGFTTPAKHLFGSLGKKTSPAEDRSFEKNSPAAGTARVSQLTPRQVDLASAEGISSILRSPLLSFGVLDNKSPVQNKPARVVKPVVPFVTSPLPLKNTRRNFWRDAQKSTEVAVEIPKIATNKHVLEVIETKRPALEASKTNKPVLEVPKSDSKKSNRKKNRISLARASPPVQVYSSAISLNVQSLDSPLSPMKTTASAVSTASPMKIEFENQKFTLSNFLDQLESSNISATASSSAEINIVSDPSVNKNTAICEVTASDAAKMSDLQTKNTANEDGKIVPSSIVSVTKDSNRLPLNSVPVQLDQNAADFPIVEESRKISESPQDLTAPPVSQDQLGETKKKKKKRNKLSLSSGAPAPIILVHSENN